MAVLICHIWQANREKIPVKIPSLGVKLFLFTITVIFLGPLLRIIFLLGFVFCWGSKKHLFEVFYYLNDKISKVIELYSKAKFHFLSKQLKTIDSMVSSWRLVVITVMYLTRVLPAPWYFTRVLSAQWSVPYILSLVMLFCFVLGFRTRVTVILSVTVSPQVLRLSSRSLTTSSTASRSSSPCWTPSSPRQCWKN